MLINPIGTLRQLKGAPLSVLIALTIVNPRLVSSSWLAGCTGYADETITRATWYLKELGLIACDSHRTNWRLVGDVQQLPLPMSMLNPEPKNPDPEKPEPDPPTTTTTLKSANNLTEGSSSSFNNRDPVKPDPDSRLALLRQGGIYEPTATELCELEHASYSYLDAHIKQAELDGTDTSLLIHRIRKNDPMPKDRSDSVHDRITHDPWLCEDCHCRPCTCDDEEEEEEIEEEI